MPESSATRRDLSSWLRAGGFLPQAIETMAGDVSHRRYWRVRLETGSSVIAVWYPSEMRSACARFDRTTTLLAAAAVRVPAVIAVDCDHGFMLVEDLGDQTLYAQHGTGGPPPEHMEQAVALIARIRNLPRGKVELLNEPLDRDLLTRELDTTWERALERAELSGTRSNRERLRASLGELVERLVERPLEPCHRDFMVRNLMVTRAGELAVIDHQDLRLGPRHYDLASLLNDSYFPRQEEEDRLCRLLLRSGDDFEQYRRCAVQRCLKAVGTFVAFAARGQRSHLGLVPASLAAASRHLARLPEGSPAADNIGFLWSVDRTRAIDWP